MRRRTVISVSISERNPDAAVVMRELAAQGIALTHSGGQILRWAAEALTRPTVARNTEKPLLEDVLGMSLDDINARLDDF